MDGDFGETWRNIPLVTRYVTVVTGVLMVLALLQPVYASYFWYHHTLPLWQVWRLATAPFAFYGNAIPAAVSLYMMATSVYELETAVFRSPGRTAYYLAWLGLGFDAVAPRLGMFYYSSGMIAAMAWTLAQENPLAVTMVAGVVPVPRRYFPLANVVMRMLSTKSVEGAYEAVLGIVLAHSFMFVTEFLPAAGGPRLFVNTPGVFGALDRVELNEQKRKEFGRGRKLNSWR